MKMRTLAGALLLAAGLATLSPTPALAYELKLNIDENASMKEILTNLKKQRVTIVLSSGQKIDGVVSRVGDTMAYITLLSSMSYHDAIIRLDKIDAIVLRMRF